MNPTLDPLELAQGQALLPRLSDTLAQSLRGARLEYQVEGYISCAFEVPGIGKRTTSAGSAYEAIRLALIELACLTTPTLEYLALQMNETSSSKDLGKFDSVPSERFQSKTRQHTVGVTLPAELKVHLNLLAESENASFAEMSRRFAVFGFEDFIDRSLYASSTALFDLLNNELLKWQSSSSEQVMLRLDPGHAVRIRSAAKEYGKSVSELSVLCVAHGLEMQALLVSLEQRISNFKGAAIRPLLPKLDLPPFATPLLSSVLAGTVRAPKTLIRKLAGIFEAPESLLSTFFRRSFDYRLVPAFKAEDGKPELATNAVSWAVAVKSLGLSAEQTKTLLDLGI
ncbi:hypothetical protein [Cellvibrio sp. PSBB023]|uniref:hypothetical protein n=1 Tax=Cellvibrio sp. PSBB023 TaxID=1945512 RepID=UPI00098FCB24|nr:hypothetical protein [Cellvibrio sp. PSBB023]AQT61470.1 hypothetical protein B0D95_16165 [Cellvibrio sp. PSBB023]